MEGGGDRRDKEGGRETIRGGNGWMDGWIDGVRMREMDVWREKGETHSYSLLLQSTEAQTLCSPLQQQQLLHVCLYKYCIL